MFSRLSIYLYRRQVLAADPSSNISRMALVLDIALLVLITAILFTLLEIKNFCRLILFKLARPDANPPAARRHGVRRRLDY